MKNRKWSCWLVLVMSFVLKFIYVYRVPYDITPHDIGKVIDYGPHAYFHADYILYWAVFRKLPDFSPVGFGEYYHPPLYYILSGEFVRKVYFQVSDLIQTFEYLQLVNMAIACLCCVVIYFILKKIGLKDMKLLLGTIFVAFCPIFYNLGAALNNDCLMVFFCLCAIYFTLCWKNSHSLGTIIGIALTLGLGILTKTSAILLSPAIGMVFLYVWIKNRKDWQNYLNQYLVFGVLCIPLGLFWVIRENLLFGMPFNYVLEVDNMRQYVGDMSLWTRMGLPSVAQLISTSVDWANIKDYANIWGQTIFTMVFDEGCFQISNPIFYIISRILLWGSWILVMGMLAAMIRLIINKEVDVEVRILFGLGYLVLLASYVSFAFQYPHMCTMNFRYIVPTLVFGISALLLETKHKYLSIITSGLMLFVSASSGILFLFCAV